MSDLKVTSDIEVITCAECTISFGVTSKLLEFRKKDGATVYCPNGHKLAYPKSTPDADRIAKLTSDIAVATKRAEMLAAWIAKAPHLATCNVRVDRPCDCGRAECVGDVAAPEVTSAN